MQHKKSNQPSPKICPHDAFNWYYDKSWIKTKQNKNSGRVSPEKGKSHLYEMSFSIPLKVCSSLLCANTMSCFSIFTFIRMQTLEKFTFAHKNLKTSHSELTIPTFMSSCVPRKSSKSWGHFLTNKWKWLVVSQTKVNLLFGHTMC